MKVVFLEDVPGTGNVGEVKVVKNGYARNYLIPRGLAAPATKGNVQVAQARAQQAAKRQAQLDAHAQGLVGMLEGKTITIQANVGEQGRLYGSVTNGDIAEELSKIVGEEVDRHGVLLPEPIRQVGEYQVRVRFTRNVETTVPVVVEAKAEE